MVDFRYHLVSLISVFLALALGVVLGAGPLQAPIASGLTDQVQNLREDQARTSAEISKVREDIGDRNRWIDEVTRKTLPGKLKDRKVAIISMQDTNGDDVKAIRDYVEVAGGTVNQEITLTPGWDSQTLSQFRSSLSGPVATHLAQKLDAEASPAAVLSQAVVEIITSDTEDTKLLREMLTDSENPLIQFEQDQTVSDSIILVGPEKVEEDLGAPEPTSADKADEEANEAPDTTMWVELASAIGRAPKSGVVVGDTSTADSLVTVIRDQQSQVTTVDSVGTSMGHSSAVLALATAQDEARAFGVASTATELVPPLGDTEQTQSRETEEKSEG